MWRRICWTPKSANWPLHGTGTSLRTQRSFLPRKLVVALINSLNAEGVRQYRRLDPDELISRMEAASRESAEFHRALDPFGTAMFPVSWAGEEQSTNWFDTAREFTERWHHQQQIRVALDKPGIMTREFYFPVLDCFMCAGCHVFLPKRIGEISKRSRDSTSPGECGGSWYLFRDREDWKLIAAPAGETTISETTIPQEIAWRIFTKGITAPEEAKTQAHVTGDEAVGLHILKMISIVG